MTPDQQLFEKVKRDGECWHSFIDYNSWYACTCGYGIEESKSAYMFSIHFKNNKIDFSTPEGFFWLWERAREKEWWELYLAGKTPDIIVSLINPLKFRASLMEFWGIKEEER
ncbi:MAG: hypothetical protein UU61_C0016G0019 [Parcubacteria group bacterium GW2011_GWB1_41_4]|nr:MAG: hypothetical protein UU61_C0016G0019 [Parcubacteria group bacterium GW2011_GWB1_41_4]